MHTGLCKKCLKIAICLRIIWEKLVRLLICLSIHLSSTSMYESRIIFINFNVTNDCAVKFKNYRNHLIKMEHFLG